MKNATIDVPAGHRLLCAAVAKPISDATGPLKQMWLAPWGEVKNKNNIRFVVDDVGVAEMIAAFKSDGLFLPVDKEHGSLKEFQTAAVGPEAFGRVVEIVPKPGEALYAMVEWSDEGRELVRSGKFFHVSPVFLIRESDNRAIGLHSVALTNTPAITNQPRVAASHGAVNEPRKENGMDKHLKALIAFARSAGKQLADNADEDTVVNAVTTIELSRSIVSTEGDEIAAEARKALGLKADASKSEIVAMCSTLRHKEAAAAATKEQLDTLQEEVREIRWNSASAPHITANRLNKRDERDMAVMRRLFDEDPASFEHQMTLRGNGNPPAGQTQPPSGTGTLSTKEDELIEAAMKVNGGRRGEAIISLQTRFVEEEKKQGFNLKVAKQRAAQSYPKIFGAAA